MAYSTATRSHNEAGDTLVEVLMSIMVLSIVIVGAMTIMNKGLGSAQLSLEHTQVRMTINAQIELLRLTRDAYIQDNLSLNGQTWGAIAVPSNTSAIVYNDTCQVTPAKAASAFYLTQGATRVNRVAYVVNPATLLPQPGQGLWIESRRSVAAVTPRYTDFVVRACWPGSGTSGVQRTVTAVRLYDPL